MHETPSATIATHHLFRRSLGVYAALIALALVGCKEANQRALSDTLEEYHHALRWNDSAGAAQHMAPEQQRRRAELGHLLQGVRIVGIEVGGVRMEGETKAKVRVRIDWYRENALSLHSTVLEQQWEQPGDNGRWVLAEQRTSSGPVFPLTVQADPPAAPGSPSASPAPEPGEAAR